MGILFKLLTKHHNNPFFLFPDYRQRILQVFLFFLFLILFTPLPILADSETESKPSPPSKTDLRIHFQYGWPVRIFSDRLYENFQMTVLGFTMEKKCGILPYFQNKKILLSVLWELRFARIWGRGIPLDNDQVSQETLARFTSEGLQPSTNWDNYQIGITPYYRLTYPLSAHLDMFGEVGLGLTYLNEPLIENGTPWNFLFAGGLGLDWKNNKWPLFMMLRFEHFCKGDGSNNWINNKPNIGPESLFIGVGIRYPINL